jgi:hypothetical protein
MTESSSNLTTLLHKNADDVVITMAIRSPLCKAKKGGFKDMRQVTPFVSWAEHTVDEPMFTQER